ncbi:MAG TPA: leucyl aminopeptidase [Draconibacterium sp.]|nr:leucyl aminopeptidase [Draconibacterium sp.]
MFPKVSKITEIRQNTSTAYLIENPNQIVDERLTQADKEYISFRLEKDGDCTIQKWPHLLYFKKIEKHKDKYLGFEAARIAGAKVIGELKISKIEQIQLINLCTENYTAAFLEGLLLSTYNFDKYLKEKETFHLKEVFIQDKISDPEIEELLALAEAVFAARNLVNEPVSYLTAPRFSEEIEKLGEQAGFSVEVFNKRKIESLKMGGLLAVNRGSIDPPTFNILEWKPQNAKNKQPIVLVGKGIVFDTGGLSLKPTANSMDYMKTDMAGGAVVASTIFAIAKNKLPVHVVGLVPATDNRPDGNAYVPGDVITMFDGTTVEVRNTDAEGRLILADALSYAKKYKPMLVIDYATLTGAADMIAGAYASVVMGNAPEHLENLKSIGFETFERIIEVPLWEEYAKALKSNIADLNNLGVREAQSTIAGKFLEHFTDYKWIHIDSAGMSYLKEADAYRPAGATGSGTRLLYHFIKASFCR